MNTIETISVSSFMTTTELLFMILEVEIVACYTNLMQMLVQGYFLA